MEALVAAGFGGGLAPLLTSSDVEIGSDAVVAHEVDMFEEGDLGVIISALNFRAAQARARLAIHTSHEIGMYTPICTNQEYSSLTRNKFIMSPQISVGQPKFEKKLIDLGIDKSLQ